MTQTLTVGGVDVTSRVRLEDGIQSLSSRADGTFASSAIRIDDPLGELTFLQLQEVTSDESACTPTRCFTGFVYNATIDHGVYRDGPGRVWELEIADLNFLMQLRVFHNAAANRPEETVTARMAWLMSSVGMAGLIFDNGLIGAVAASFTVGATDYRGKYANDVLMDCVVVGRVFFVYYDHAATPGEEASLFFQSPNGTTHTSTLKVSNVESDVDNVTTFWGYWNAALNQAGDAIFTGVYWHDPTNRIYRERQATIDAFGIRRDGVYEDDRPRSASRASTNVDEWLVKHSGALETIGMVVRLPRDKVNLIEAGMRLAIRETHLPGYDDPGFTYTRVTARTLTFTEGRNDYYDVQLELSVAGISQVGGGDPGVFPQPVSCIPGTAERVPGNAVNAVPSGSPAKITLPAPGTEGNTVRVFMTKRTDAVISSPIGFTDSGLGVLSAGNTAPSPGEAWAAIAYRWVQPGDTADIEWAGGGVHPGMAYADEIVGQVTPEGVGFLSSDPYTTPNAPFLIGSITPATGRLGTITGYTWMKRNTGDVTAATGYNLLISATTDAVVFHALVEKVVASSTGSYTPGFITGGQVAFDNHSYGGMTLAWLCSASDNPPSPAQWVYGEVVTPAPDGVETTFSTAFPFADGSLVVYVDNLDQTAAVSSFDGATGEFTLSFAPWGTDIVTVDYQGR